MQVGDIVLVSGPFIAPEADGSIAKFDGSVGIVLEEKSAGYTRVFCPFHPDHIEQLDWAGEVYGTLFLNHEVTPMVVGD